MIYIEVRNLKLDDSSVFALVCFGYAGKLHCRHSTWLALDHLSNGGGENRK